MLSIVTATYRDPEGLKKTIDSLKPLFESRKIAWEHVLVDSSPEENEKVLASAPSQWPLVRKREPARGIYAALNAGVAVAKGRYLWFLNGGDELFDLEVLLDFVKKFEVDPDLDFICGGAELTRGGEFLYFRKPDRMFLKNILGSNRICQQAVVYRASLFDRIGGFDANFRIAADYEHHYRAYLTGLKCECKAGVLVRYDMGGTSSDHVQALEEFRQVQKSVRGRIPKWAGAANDLLWHWERSRIGVLKAASRSRFARILRPLWLAWNRRK